MVRDLSAGDFDDVLVHGANLKQKEHHRTKYRDDDSRRKLEQIRTAYEKWKRDNLDLRGPFSKPTTKDDVILDTRVSMLASYKDFIDRQEYAEQFDSRSALHSSVLEEFMYYLFRDLVEEFGGRPIVGKSHTFKDLFFMPPSFSEMVRHPYARVEMKDHDFTIGAGIEVELRCRDTKDTATALLEVPAVAIECKTYLDKTMLEGSSGAAEQLKLRHPNAIYVVVSEWLKLTGDINLKKYKVDQIYVMRRQKNTDREFRFAESYDKRPIDPDVVRHLYGLIRSHLTSDWGGGIEQGLSRGWLI
jgi:hypothetical protein